MSYFYELKIYFDDYFQRDNFAAKYYKKGMRVLKSYCPQTNTITIECSGKLLKEIKNNVIVGDVKTIGCAMDDSWGPEQQNAIT